MNEDMKDILTVIKVNFATIRTVVIAVLLMLAIIILLQFGTLYILPLVMVLYIVALVLIIRNVKTSSLQNIRSMFAFLLASGIKRKNMFRGHVIMMLIPIPVVFMFMLIYDIPEITLWQKMLAASAAYAVITVFVMMSYIIEYKVSEPKKGIGILLALGIIAAVATILFISFTLTVEGIFVCAGIMAVAAILLDVFLYRKGMEAIESMDV